MILPEGIIRGGRRQSWRRRTSFIDGCSWRLSDVDDEGRASNNVNALERGPKAMGVLIVTGGSRGIGAEIGRLAGARGWSVCVNYAASEDMLTMAPPWPP